MTQDLVRNGRLDEKQLHDTIKLDFYRLHMANDS